MFTRQGSRIVVSGLAVGALGVVGPVLGELVPSAGAAPAPNATALAAQSLKALSSASTFTINAFIDKAGRRTSVVVRSTDGGNEAYTRFAVGPVGKPPSELARVVRQPSALYINANQRFWLVGSHGKISKAALRQLGGHWIKAPMSKVSSLNLGTITLAPKVAHELLAGKSGFTMGPVETVRGVRTRAIADPAKKAVLYTSLADNRPVLAQKTQPGSAAAIIFGYPSTLHIATPAGALPFSKLQQELKGSSGS